MKSIYPPLYQCKPDPGFPHGIWQDQSQKTIAGAIWNADKTRKALRVNEKLRGKPYDLIGTIRIYDDLSEADVDKTWTKITRALREHGVEAYWIREITKKNRVHYHTLHGAGPTDPKTLKSIIKTACPTLTFNMQFEAPRKVKDWRNYIVKAQIGGKMRHGRRKGQWVDDVYKDKRILFTKECGLKKDGKIGDFWLKTKKTFRQEAQAFAKLRDDPDVINAAAFMAYRSGDKEETVRDRYTQQLQADPTFRATLQQEANLYYSGQLDYGQPTTANAPIVPFSPYTPKPAPRGTRKKNQPPKAYVPFDPAKCDSQIWVA